MKMTNLLNNSFSLQLGLRIAEQAHSGWHNYSLQRKPDLFHFLFQNLQQAP